MFYIVSGFGVVCLRVLKTVADLVGIKDIYIKTEGNTKNVNAIAISFITGLTKMVSDAC